MHNFCSVALLHPRPQCISRCICWTHAGCTKSRTVILHIEEISIQIKNIINNSDEALFLHQNEDQSFTAQKCASGCAVHSL